MSVPFHVNLKDQVAVITGGGGILCGEMARALAECGAKVAILDLKIEAAQKVADAITQAGGVAKGFACNALDKASIEAAHEQVRAAFGPVDILINGAGGNHPKGTTSKEYLSLEDITQKKEGVTTFYDLTVEGIQFVFNLNFLGTFLPTQVFSRDMVLKKHGNIINISSMNAFKPLTKIPAYSAAKASVSNFTQWLAVHFSKTGVRVNAIAPGFFLTDQNRGLLTQADGAATARGNTIISHTPQGKYGTPEDLVGPLLWLLSEKGSGFVTGQVIAVDGGFSAFSGV
jgi:NAD(P)-dependent dehydrogenase (short-subunit alcohol dehydrogenase family)